MLKNILNKGIRIIQKAVIAVSLCLIYIIGFGITLVIICIFNRKMLWPREKDEDTFWQEARGYTADRGQCLRGS